MSTESSATEAAFLATVDTRLSIWRIFWNFFMASHFVLGITGVVCSTLAASELVDGLTRQWLSLVAAICIAIIGFLRPETRYRNLVQSWCDLKAAKEHYLFYTEERKHLLEALRASERNATDDDPGRRPAKE